MTAPRRPDPLTLAGFLAVAAGAAFVVSTGQVAALHCDETNVFRQATTFSNGEFGSPGRPGLLWLALAPFAKLGDPVVATRVFRLVAALASAVTLLAVLAVGGRGGDEASARTPREQGFAGLAGVVLLATSLDWQGHAFEVRTDTFVVPLVLLAGLQLWRREPGLRRAALAGGLIAASGLISQKSVYNAVGLGLSWGVFVLASGRPFQLGARFKEAAVLVAVTLAVMGLWFAGLSAVNGPDGGATVSHTFQTAQRTAFGLDDMAWETKVEQLEIASDRAPVLWAVAAIGGLWALAMARRRPRMAAVAVLGGTMLATIYVHRGFRTYYVASIEPYLAVVGGGMLGHLAARLAARAPAVVAALPIVAAGAIALGLSMEEASNLRATSMRGQLSVMEDVHEAFPEPVPYFDLLHLVPGYPEVTFLGTGPQRMRFRDGRGRLAAAALGDGATTAERRAAHRSARDRAFINRARARQPRFFIRDYMSRDRYFKSDELRWWWKHFVPYRPNLYLLGGRIRVPARGRVVAHNIDVLVAGEYTVWFRGDWSGTARIADREVVHGEVIRLEEGRIRISARADEGEGELQFLIGTDREPMFPSPEDQLDYSMFPRDRRDRFQTYDRRGKPGDLLTPDWDPAASESDLRARRKRHRQYQVKRQETWASP